MTKPVLRLEVTFTTAQRSDGKWIALAMCNNGMRAKSPPFKTRAQAKTECDRMLAAMKEQLPREMAPLGFDVEIVRVGKA